EGADTKGAGAVVTNKETAEGIAPERGATTATATATATAATSAGRAAEAQLLGVDQGVPEGPGPGRQRQAGLPDRQGWRGRDRPAGGGRRADRGRRGDEEDPARDTAARHGAAAGHARGGRSGPADERALRDLRAEWLHGRLRGERRAH